MDLVTPSPFGYVDLIRRENPAKQFWRSFRDVHSLLSSRNSLFPTINYVNDDTKSSSYKFFRQLSSFSGEKPVSALDFIAKPSHGSNNFESLYQRSICRVSNKRIRSFLLGDDAVVVDPLEPHDYGFQTLLTPRAHQDLSFANILVDGSHRNYGFTDQILSVGHFFYDAVLNSLQQFYQSASELIEQHGKICSVFSFFFEFITTNSLNRREQIYSFDVLTGNPPPVSFDDQEQSNRRRSRFLKEKPDDQAFQRPSTGKAFPAR